MISLEKPHIGEPLSEMVRRYRKKNDQIDRELAAQESLERRVAAVELSMESVRTRLAALEKGRRS